MENQTGRKINSYSLEAYRGGSYSPFSAIHCLGIQYVGENYETFHYAHSIDG